MLEFFRPNPSLFKELDWEKEQVGEWSAFYTLPEAHRAFFSISNQRQSPRLIAPILERMQIKGAAWLGDHRCPLKKYLYRISVKKQSVAISYPKGRRS